MNDAFEIGGPDCNLDAQTTFGLNLSWPLPAFSKAQLHVPELDPLYQFDPDVCRAILLGFTHNRRVYLHGPHGSGKSTHIEQVAARLNWPCLRINLDGHVTRADLIGRDMVVIREGKQATEFVPGLLVWALQRPVALVLDEYDAGRPDVMLVIQRVLEAKGRLTLLDQNRVITPHPAFRLFATANTNGMGDSSGMYVGTQAINQAQLDRWSVVAQLDYLPAEQEQSILAAYAPQIAQSILKQMVTFAGLCRRAQRLGDLTVLLSMRILFHWCESLVLLGDMHEAFRLAFLNRCEDTERLLVAEIYQRCFAEDLPGTALHG
jgi:cobaltochelatase CobS